MLWHFSSSLTDWILAQFLLRCSVHIMLRVQPRVVHRMCCRALFAQAFVLIRKVHSFNMFRPELPVTDRLIRKLFPDLRSDWTKISRGWYDACHRGSTPENVRRMCRPATRSLGDAVPALIPGNVLPELRGACSRPTSNATNSSTRTYEMNI